MLIQKETEGFALLIGPVVLSSDHLSPALDRLSTLVVAISKRGGAFGFPVGEIAEVGFGWYKIGPDAADTDTTGPLIASWSGPGIDRNELVYEVVNYDPYEDIGAILRKVALLGTGTLTTTAVVQASGETDVWRARTYSVASGGQALTYDVSGVDLVGATIKLIDQWDNVLSTGTCSNPGEPVQHLTFEMDDAVTATLKSGNDWTWEIVAFFPSEETDPPEGESLEPEPVHVASISVNVH